MLLGHRHTPSARISEPGGIPACGVLVGGISVWVGARVGADVGVTVGSGVLVGGIGVSVGVRVGVDVGITVGVSVSDGVAVDRSITVGVSEKTGECVGKGVYVGNKPTARRDVSTIAAAKHPQQQRAIARGITGRASLLPATVGLTRMESNFRNIGSPPYCKGIQRENTHFFLLKRKPSIPLPSFC